MHDNQPIHFHPVIKCILIVGGLLWMVEQYLCRCPIHSVSLDVVQTGAGDTTEYVVHCSHGIAQAADSFHTLFALLLRGSVHMPTGGCWISHTRDPCDMLEGEDVVSRCCATTTARRALFVGHSMGAVPAVRAARQWMLLGHQPLGVVLLAPAVDANDRFWDSMPLQHMLYAVFCCLLPEAWQRLVAWGPVVPVVLWWVILSYLGNGWASLHHIHHQRASASDGVCAVRHLITINVAHGFNETLAFLLQRNVDVVVVYDENNGMF